MNFYNRAPAIPAGASPVSRVVPQPTAPIGGTIPATMEAQARREHKLALENHRMPMPTGKELHRQLKIEEKCLLREIQTIEKGLAAVRQKIAQLAA
jgi:hypothetical protein